MSLDENYHTSPISAISISDDEENIVKLENKDSTDSDESKENREEHIEIQEQVYQDKLLGILKQIQQLENGSHVEYVRQLKKLEIQKKNELIMNNLWRDCLLEAIEREFIKERRLAHKEFEDRSFELTENLIAELNERKKAVEHDNLNMELCPDSEDQKPSMTRKLRRRPNDPVIQLQAPQEKRRKPPPVSIINYMLREHEIEQDIKTIKESMASLPTTSTAATSTIKLRDTINSSSIQKSGVLSSSSTTGCISPKKCLNFDNERSLAIPDTRIVDGKLHFEKKWYHRGQPVFVEGKQMAKFAAVISAIGNETIWVKKTTDNSKFRINLSYLSNGKMSIKRRATV